MVKVTYRDQQVDLEGMSSNLGAGELDSGFQLSVKQVSASARVTVRAFDSL